MRKHFEPMMHLLCLGYPVTAAFVCLGLELFNPMKNMCYIADYPPGCTMNKDIECIRGEHAATYRWAFSGVPMFATLFLVPFTIAVLSWTVWKQNTLMETNYGRASWSLKNSEQEGGRPKVLDTKSMIKLPNPQKKNGRMEREGDMQQESRKNSRQKRSVGRNQTMEVVHQAMRYVASFLLAHIWPLAIYIAYANTPIEDEAKLAPLMILSFVFNPMMGLFNFLIYIRPRTLRLRRLKNCSYMRAMILAAIHPNEPSLQLRRQSNHTHRYSRQVTESRRKI